MILKKLNCQNTIIVSPIICSIVLAIFILLTQQSLPLKMPLFYSLPWGEQQLASLPQFLIIPLVAASLSLINLLIIWHLGKDEALLKKILLVTSLVICVSLILATVKIVLIFI